MASKSAQVRSSGETAAQETTKDVSENFDKSIDVELPESERRVFRTPGFTRMRLDWTSDDRVIIARAKAAVEGRILKDFQDAYQLMFDVYDLVRTAEVDSVTGEILTDQFGFKKWHRNIAGSYEEDWTKLSAKQKENFLFAITTRLFEWSQTAADIWAEAMFAKAQWEERFSIGFDSPATGTVDDRRASGNLDSREERYFAIFMSAYSRKADALVSTLNLLGQRLKDSLSA